MPYLYGERVRLRAAEKSDISLFHKWINDPDVTENLIQHYPISITEEEAWYERMLATPIENHVHVIEIRQNDEQDLPYWLPIGNIQFLDIHWRPRHSEVGIMIGEKDYWDQGYGSEAMKVLLKHGFETLNLNRIWLVVYEKNLRGISAYKKCGFKEEGRLREAHYQHGHYYDIIVMSVLRKEWDTDKENI